MRRLGPDDFEDDLRATSEGLARRPWLFALLTLPFPFLLLWYSADRRTARRRQRFEDKARRVDEV